MKKILLLAIFIFSTAIHSQPITGGSGTGPSRPLAILTLNQFLLTPEFKKNESVYKNIIANEKKLLLLVSDLKIKNDVFGLNKKPENLVDALLLIFMSDSVGKATEDSDCVECNQSKKLPKIRNKEIKKVLKDISDDPAFPAYLKIRFYLEGGTVYSLKANIDQVLNEE